MFKRGDCNSDNSINIADPVFLLGWLFVAGSDRPECELACDVNDDETINVADAVYLLNALFVGGSPPVPPPNPDCGIDPSLTFDLDCENSPCP